MSYKMNATFIRRVKRYYTVTPEEFASIKGEGNRFPEDCENKMDCLKFVPKDGDKFPVPYSCRKEYADPKKIEMCCRYVVCKCDDGCWRECREMSAEESKESHGGMAM